jgi:septal ring factor EnvC (AmiA/AmiB activator)
LRRHLAQLRRDAHQALGTASTHADHGVVEELQREAAELRVQLMDERDTTRGLRETVHDLADELTAAREIARDYLRDLNQARADLRTTRHELMKLRTQTTSTGPSPVGAELADTESTRSGPPSHGARSR